MSNTLTNVLTRRTFGIVRKLIAESLTKEINNETKLCAVSCNFWVPKKDVHTNRKFSVDTVKEGSAARAETTSTTQGLSKLQAQELILRLTDEERNVLISALQEYQSKVVNEEYAAQQVPRPTTRNLVDIAIANSIPFIGFGFLDNFFMLIFGDYIDFYLGSYFVLTTMAAAALGNTFSDILGIGTAFYVERLANKVGYNPPKLSPMQIDLPISRNFANLGRVLGVTLGCILGMVPLLFFKRSEKNESSKEDKKNSK